jgi:large conductance mechanosensitive channel
MWKEFKEFTTKGNVLDLAIGVIIGGAFGKIVTSLVNDIIMPVVGMATAGVDIKTLKYIIKPAVVKEGVEMIAESAIRYGLFIQNIIDFIIIAFCIFYFVRSLNKNKKKEEEKPAAPKGPTSEELLVEIRDILKKS